MRLPLLLVVLTAAGAVPAAAQTPDVMFVPTNIDVALGMLRIAGVGDSDVVYDLGSGDGRIPITAAKVYGARGVGIDIDPERINEANTNARVAGVTGNVRFLNEDLFKADISAATVVTLFLTPSLNISLLPKLNRELKPGTRIVSHRWEMKDVAGREYLPRQKLLVDGSNVYLWTIPIQ